MENSSAPVFQKEKNVIFFSYPLGELEAILVESLINHLRAPGTQACVFQLLLNRVSISPTTAFIWLSGVTQLLETSYDSVVLALPGNIPKKTGYNSH